MSITLLLEKYDVSTDEGLQKAISEIEKEEAEVDEALSGALSRACAVEGRLRTASQAYARLGEVRSDGQAAASMVQRTADLARDVSAKVRQLDLARSRVAECQRRVHDLIDLQLCSAGVDAAILAHDYETGAAHVARFLSMDPGSVAAAQAHGVANPRDAMTRAAETLRDSLVRKLEEAARKDDDASVERLFKLFPQIGRADEGVDLLARYIAKHMESWIRRNGSVGGGSAEGAVFADALTRLLEAGGASVERARTLSAAAGAPGRLARALALLQPVICSGARRLVAEMRSARGLGAAPSDPRRAPQPPEPLALEPTLAELALMHSRTHLYFTFLRRKAEADAASLEEPARAAAVEAAHKLIAECELMRLAHDLLAHYLALERYFLEECVGKALRLASPQPGATASSLVDDVFYIARKCIRRGISTGSVDGACAVLNEAATQLERDVAAALRRWLRSPPADPLPLAPPPGTAAAPLDLPALPAATATLLGQRLNRDLDAQRALFLAHVTEADAGAEWAQRLAADACLEAEPLLRGCAGSERAKLQSCASGLASAAASFRAAHDLALAGLRTALKPRAAAWAEAVATPAGDEDTRDAGEALPAALDELAASAHAELPSRAADALLAAVVGDIATRAESRMLQHSYEREAGLAVERRARRLAAWAGGCAAGARERCARLTQAASLLALERLAHVHDALQPAPRLAAHEAKDLLARRTDFKMEDIKRLKI